MDELETFDEKVMKRKLLEYVKRIFKGEETDLYSCPYCYLIFQDVKQHLLAKRSCRFFKKEIKNCRYYDEQVEFVAKFFCRVYDVEKEELVKAFQRDKQREHTQMPFNKEKDIRAVIKEFAGIVKEMELKEREDNVTMVRKVLNL